MNAARPNLFLLVVWLDLLWAAVSGMLVTAYAQGPNQAPSPSQAWHIEVRQPSREVIFTNKRATHFATDTAARDMRSYAGLYTSMHESLDDYVVTIDGVPLRPEESLKATVTPWSLMRHHPNGILEEVFLPDDKDVLLVRLSRAGNLPIGEWTLTPRVDLRWIWKIPAAQYTTQWQSDCLVISRDSYEPGPGAPTHLAVATDASAKWQPAPRSLNAHHPRDAARRAMADTHPFEPGVIGGATRSSTMDIAFAAGSGAESTADLAREALRQRDSWLALKRERITQLVATTGLRTGDARLDRAYSWARASLDAMVMQSRGTGIYAGFHWFTNYWGRDTFISLPGATLVTGQLDVAKSILESFLDYQLTDRASERLGRLPNIVQPGSLQYAGVDGTWWYVRAAHRYILARRANGEADLAFERSFAAALSLMIQGAETKAVDEMGFLRHGDGETWMDAGGEGHPYSPRGDRAVEVQALYYNGLRVAQWLFANRGESDKSDRYAQLADRTRTAFRGSFWDSTTKRLADHLNIDGSRDLQVRPNTILALTAVDPSFPPLLEPDQAASVVELVYDRLVLPYGITSLDPSDAAFHPRHLDLSNYYYDEAYHNGDVWFWLTGPMITALCRVGRVQDALALLDPLVDDCLDHGAVGAIREIRDGGDTGEVEEFGGATFQAWSMAEMIRAMHEDLAPALGWSEP